MSPSDLLQREEAVASLGGGRANTIVQSYVTNPLLVDGLKFDLRIYALVVCVNPLRVLVYREGLARFCTSPFQSPTKANLDNTFMHLTNYAVNKHNVNFVQNDKPGPSRIASASGSKVEDVESTTEGNDNQMHEDGASKRSLTWLRSWLAECGVDAEVIWSKIADVVVKTVISIQPSLAQNYRSAKVNAQNQNPFTCFEVIGTPSTILLYSNTSPIDLCDILCDS